MKLYLPIHVKERVSRIADTGWYEDAGVMRRVLTIEVYPEICVDMIYYKSEDGTGCYIMSEPYGNSAYVGFSSDTAEGYTLSAEMEKGLIDSVKMGFQLLEEQIANDEKRMKKEDNK